MLATVEHLKKLRGKNWPELQTRGKQQLVRLGERLLPDRACEMSDGALLREIVPAARHGSAGRAAARLLERIRAAADRSPSAPCTFFPAIACRDHTAATMESRFSHARRAILDRADQVRTGRFALLGLDEIGFGDPIDWRLDPVSRKRTPLIHWSRIDCLAPEVAGDVKLIWELNRHGHFVTLGQAYWLTGDERYVETFVSQATAWMAANPPTRGINWASSLEVAFRAIAWLWALHLCGAARSVMPEFVLRLLKHLIAHGTHIQSHLSYYFSPNTHLTGEALGLFYLGTALPELRRAHGWRELGLRVLCEALRRHVRPDGVYFEQSSYYHRYTADFYTHLLVLAHASGVSLPGEVEEKLVLLIDHLLWITRPDGTSPLVGDDDGGRLIPLAVRPANDFRDTLATGAALLGRPDWKFVAGEAAPEILWLLGPAGLARYDQIRPEAPREQARAFADGGYYLVRDGWEKDDSYALIDCGPHGGLAGCGHAHADALAFEFAAGGATWLIDPGTFIYAADPQARDEFRRTEAHNTLTVDELSQSVPTAPFWWSHIAGSHARRFVTGERCVYFEGSHDGYRRLSDPVIHTRGVLFVKADRGRGLPAYLVLRDMLAAVAHHRYALRFHFPARVHAAAKHNQVTAIEPGGGGLMIRVFGPAGLQTGVTDGWVSTCYRRREPAPVAVIEARGVGPQDFLTVVVPTMQRRDIHVQLIDTRQFGPGWAWGLEFIAGTARDVALFGPPPESVVAWRRFVNGRLVGEEHIGRQPGRDPAPPRLRGLTSCNGSVALAASRSAGSGKH